ncbi:MAG: hypothetical protein LBL34_03880 [Clostridiales bacterium]|jgi:hypothetical protein|nr:hypothetical protein [Clostridiales bacterium]
MNRKGVRIEEITGYKVSPNFACHMEILRRARMAYEATKITELSTYPPAH